MLPVLPVLLSCPNTLDVCAVPVWDEQLALTTFVVIVGAGVAQGAQANVAPLLTPLNSVWLKVL